MATMPFTTTARVPYPPLTREVPAQPCKPSPARGQPATPAQSLLTALKAAWRRRRSRTILAELDDFMLKDIGLTRTEAQYEASKPFWQI